MCGKTIRLSIAMVMAFAVATFCCTDASTVAGEKRFIVGLEYSASSCNFCQNFANVTKEYGEAAGLTVILTQGNRNVANQITNAEAMLAQGAKVIGGFWDDTDACLPIATACEEQGVWCIGVLTSLTNRANGYDKYRFVGSENYDGGYLQGEWAAKNLPENAKIVYLRGLQSDQQDQDRGRGFMEALEAGGRTDIKVLDTQYSQNDRDKGLQIMENWIQAFPQIDGVVAFSDEVGCPAVVALKSADRLDDTIVMSFDGSSEAQGLILKGEMAISVLQDYKAQAQAYIDLCIAIRDGAEVGDMKVPFTLITAENVENYLDY